MTQDQINGIIRSVLILAGTYLFGHNIFGTTINESLWQEITGTVMVIAGFVWSYLSKSLTIEMFQTTILKVIMVGGALLVSSGRLKSDSLAAIAALFTSLAPILYGFLSKKKSEKVAEGQIPTSKLAK